MLPVPTSSALKLRSVVLHVTCTRAHKFILATTPSALGAGHDREYEIAREPRACIYIYKVDASIYACVLAIYLGFVTTPRVLHVMCLIISVSLISYSASLANSQKHGILSELHSFEEIFSADVNSIT